MQTSDGCSQGNQTSSRGTQHCNSLLLEPSQVCSVSDEQESVAIVFTCMVSVRLPFQIAVSRSYFGRSRRALTTYVNILHIYCDVHKLDSEPMKTHDYLFLPPEFFTGSGNVYTLRHHVSGAIGSLYYGLKQKNWGPMRGASLQLELLHPQIPNLPCFQIQRYAILCQYFKIVVSGKNEAASIQPLSSKETGVLSQ